MLIKCFVFVFFNLHKIIEKVVQRVYGWMDAERNYHDNQYLKLRKISVKKCLIKYLMVVARGIDFRRF